MDRATPTSRSERPLIHNPNYPPRPSPSYPSFNPPQHPTPQQPAFDPFQRRDPFMPASQPEKRESSVFGSSYNSNDTRNSFARPPDFPSKDVLQPAQPPPPSPFTSGPASLFKDGEQRGKSLTGTFSEVIESQIPPAPPPSLFSRQMPPPSSSPAQNTAPAYAGAYSRNHIVTPPSSRDGASSQRQGNNMSIQSIMGSEPSSAPPTSSWSINRLKPDTRRPPHTPERNMGEQRSQPGSQLGSPENTRMGMSRLLQPFSMGSPNSSTVPPRPYSQPAGSDVPHRDPNQLDNPALSPHKRKFDEFAMMSRRMGSDERERLPNERASRDRSISDLVGSKSHLHSLGLSRPAASDHNGNHRHVRDRLGSSLDNTRDYGSYSKKYEFGAAPSSFSSTARPRSFGPEIYDDLQRFHSDQRAPSNHFDNSTSLGDYRIDYGASPQIANDGSAHKSSAPENQLRRSIEDAQLPLKPVFNAQTEAARRVERGSPLPQAVQGVSAQPVGSGRDPGIKTEFGRMFSGLGSGVGSTPQPPAVASSNGAPTPSRQSPVRGDDDSETLAKNGQRDPRLGPRMGLQTMSYPDDDRRPDSDSEGRLSPAPADDGGEKRSQRAQSTHHHHHHLGGAVHHHHHHHWRPEDEPSPPLARRVSGTPMAKSSSQPAYNAAHGAFQPHHHHHIHAHHHHHTPVPGGTNQSLRSYTSPPQPIHRPTATVKTLALLSSLSNLPRKHLGSQLYLPSVTPPPSNTTALESKFCYSIVPNSLPRFDGKENCTFTIRVPGTYLSDSTRELICRERRVWGTDVYTDDSDPLGAAIHAGWILGAWADDVDIAALDLRADPPQPTTENGGAGNDGSRINGGSSEKTTPADVATRTAGVNGTITGSNAALTEPPSAGPVVPPAGHDLHLTVLILPTLEHYASSVWHGLKSRTWASNHDGMSFKVHKVDWVIEGEGSRFEERGGSARKKRIAATINERRSAMRVR